ncbi:cytochrome c biogenesis factor [Alcanivorax sp. S71-1-4]|nr:cytochrome c biogenesis factor [Alcanivorax sp. S71-1-4]
MNYSDRFPAQPMRQGRRRHGRWPHLLLAGVMLLTPPAFAQQAGDSVQALYRQAEFWEANNRNDLAAEALQRVLEVQPDDPEALYQLARLAMEMNDDAALERWSARLQRAAPDTIQWRQLQQLRQRNRIDSAGLAEARRLAQAGDSAAALQRYRSLFDAQSPPPDLALEYYQTMAGVPEEWPAARRGLEALLARNPDDRTVAVALAEILTWREGSRTEGIRRLEQIATEQGLDTRTRALWRQALVWLPAEQGHADYFRRYLVRFPDDTEISRKLSSAGQPARGADRAAGYAALERGEESPARNAFNRALRADPNDAQALAGLGLVQLRAGEFSAARVSLSRASQLEPAQASQWRDALASARFYEELEAARAQVAAGQLDQAAARLAPLASDPQRGADARLLQGDIQLRRDRPDAAEDIYRALLLEDNSLQAARAGLANALLAQRRFDEAEAVYADLPASARGEGDFRQQRVAVLREDAEMLIAQGDVVRGEALLQQALLLRPQDPWTRLSLARLADQRGQPLEARNIMLPLAGDQAKPLGLRASAMLAVDQARWDDAVALLRRIPAAQRDADTLALLATAERGQRIAALDLTLSSNDPWQVSRALDQLYTSPPEDPREVGAAAMALVEHGEHTLALVLVRRDLSDSLAGDLVRAPDHYLDHVQVLARAGQEFEAERLLQRLQQASANDPATLRELVTVRRGLVVARADRLRTEGALAQAYDELVRELNRAPDDTALLLALGRLYQQGGMHEEARQVQDYVLARAPGNSEARQAAVQGALAAGDTRRAEQLLADAAPLTEPAMLLLAARTASAQGEKREAIQLARQARDAEQARNLSRFDAWQSGVLADLQQNPFRRRGGAGHESRWQALTSAPVPQDDNPRGAWLPGQRRSSGAWQPATTDQRRYASESFDTGLPATPAGAPAMVAGSDAPASAYPSWGVDNWSASAPGYTPHRYGDPYTGYGSRDMATLSAAPGSRRPTPAEQTRIEEIDTFLDQLQDEVATRAGGALAIRHRDGESGLSGLTEVSGEISLSGVPLESGRVALKAMPVFLNAGAVSGSARGRFGSGPLVSGAEALDEALSAVQSLLDGVTQTAYSYDQAEQALAAAIASGTATPQEIAALEATRDTALLNFQSGASRNLLFEAGIDIDALPAAQRAFLDDFLQNEFGSSDFSLDDTDLAAYLASSGRLEQLVADIRGRAIAYSRAARAPDTQSASGLGLSLGYQDGSFSADIGSTPLGFEVENLIGGLQWQPEVAGHTRVLLRGQRRAVTDSLLSYSGVEDPVSGRRWGGVVRTGGDLGLNYDDGYLGVYGSVGLYRYTGRQVADNRGLFIGVGSYLRPINEAYRTLQAGVNVNYMGFRDNLGYFTLGHGGYFSPQSYVSLSLPVSYTRTRQRLTWRASVAPGFQSYSQDASPYFPTRSRDQMWLDILATSGVLPASYYAADSDSGLGLNMGLGMQYRVGPGLELGARIDYDTFGEYSETSALIHLNYTLEPRSD